MSPRQEGKRACRGGNNSAEGQGSSPSPPPPVRDEKLRDGRETRRGSVNDPPSALTSSTSRSLSLSLSSCLSSLFRVEGSFVRSFEGRWRKEEGVGRGRENGGGGGEEDANQMPTEAATSKGTSVRPCHQLRERLAADLAFI